MLRPLSLLCMHRVRQGVLLAGGSLSLAPRSLNEHMSRRNGGRIVNPAAVYTPKELSKLRGSKWSNLEDQAPITATPCGNALSTQQWVWNVTAPNYLTNVGTQLCLNTDDCGSDLIAYTCVTSGTTCCGAGCFKNMEFVLGSDGTLTTPSQPGMCVTFQGSNLQVSLSACSPSAATQKFTYSASDKTLSLSTSQGKQCLTVGNGGDAYAVIGRPLVDGSWAVAFLNAGPTAMEVVCDAACLQEMGWEVAQALSIRDLWAHAELADVVIGSTNLTVTLDADGGSAMYRVTPKFNATLPPA